MEGAVQEAPAVERAKIVGKAVYRALLPKAIRRSPRVARAKADWLGHDWLYDEDYYRSTVEGPAARSAARIASSIIEEFGPGSVIDVGCGTGALLETLRMHGCEVSGLEYSEAALRYCRARRLDVAKFNLETDAAIADRVFDVAVSLEVAEHLPEIAAERYVELLARLSRVVVFTAATPGQGGAGHVNEQPPSYWIRKFERHRLEHDEGLSRRWRERWQAAGDVEVWYCRNLMLFRRDP